MIEYIIEVLAYFITNPIILVVILICSFIGILGGAMPGITGIMMISLLLPFSFAMEPHVAVIAMIAIYAGATYGGSISAILLGIPGDVPAIATTFDGFQLAKKGRVVEALSLARFYSFVGGIFGALLLFITPLIAEVAVLFGPAEIFALIFFAISFLSAFKPRLKSLIGALFGFFLTTVGMDYFTGKYRFTFGNIWLTGGFNLVPIILGLFGVSQIFKFVLMLEEFSLTQLSYKWRELYAPKFSFFKKAFPLVLGMAAPIGFLIGFLPGLGASVGALIAYMMGKRLSKDGAKWGTGMPEGVAVPEAANNAAAMGTLVLTLALGIPGGGQAAVMLAALLIHGVLPGPFIFKHQPILGYSILVGAILANIIMYLEAPLIISIFRKVAIITYRNLPIMAGIILLLCVSGTYVIRNNLFDIWTLLIFGIIGFFLDRYGFPLAPIVIAFVLGEEAEVSFRRALEIGKGDPLIFFRSQIGIFFMILAIASFVIPTIYSKIIKKVLP